MYIEANRPICLQASCWSWEATHELGLTDLIQTTVKPTTRQAIMALPLHQKRTCCQLGNEGHCQDQFQAKIFPGRSQ